ncbi:hypothetical protein [Sphingomonas sp.]|uniref:hypothetical protein n=1 Tax=Sphingomonas sp. TaxID=28214 RepID=UPI001D5C6705|nr:hypothetical protein [Sphingomonas sp.]MBX9797706.1 hypothetical protein [Sphingomonas sp.]
MAFDRQPPIRQGHPIRNVLVRRHRADETAPSRDEDLKLFALSFTAFFVCIYTLIF